MESASFHNRTDMPVVLCTWAPPGVLAPDLHGLQQIEIGPKEFCPMPATSTGEYVVAAANQQRLGKFQPSRLYGFKCHWIGDEGYFVAHAKAHDGQPSAYMLYRTVCLTSCPVRGQL